MPRNSERKTEGNVVSDIEGRQDFKVIMLNAQKSVKNSELDLIN